MNLTDQNLETLGVVLGDRRKMLRAIAKLRYSGFRHELQGETALGVGEGIAGHQGRESDPARLTIRNRRT